MDLWLIILLARLVFGILPVLVMSYVIYSVLLIRTSKEKWGRTCSIPDDEEYKRMFDIGMDWDAKYGACKRAVSVKSGNLDLAGEYFDFGGERAVIIIPGRMESCLYSYFFAEPYRACGCNVLVIDNRAHGLSDGKVSSLGYKEYKDILAWSDLLRSLGNRKIILHGICIGASCALFAATAKEAPDVIDAIDAIVAEGMYTTFFESLKNHMYDGGRPVFPFAYGILVHIRLISGANVLTDGPVKRIKNLQKPILFLHSKEDIFSLPKKAEILYASCPAEKTLVWFDHGAHSRIRINNESKYDRAIAEFLQTL
ncbi:MAG: alpha/beta hydrolase [Clostridia bacterium]|nr:alpha/beta hydrolase [Clostridia bacterium]